MVAADDGGAVVNLDSKKLANLPSVMALKDQFEDADVLIVSPGPSLASDLELLTEVHDRFLVIATMKALGALFDAGIRPDLAIWQDPQDHSDAIPTHTEIADVGLILNEGCHPAFYEANFATHFAYPEPVSAGQVSRPHCMERRHRFSLARLCHRCQRSWFWHWGPSLSPC